MATRKGEWNVSADHVLPGVSCRSQVVQHDWTPIDQSDQLSPVLSFSKNNVNFSFMLIQREKNASLGALLVSALGITIHVCVVN